MGRSVNSVNMVPLGYRAFAYDGQVIFAQDEQDLELTIAGLPPKRPTYLQDSGKYWPTVGVAPVDPITPDPKRVMVLMPNAIGRKYLDSPDYLPILSRSTLNEFRLWVAEQAQVKIAEVSQLYGYSVVVEFVDYDPYRVDGKVNSNQMREEFHRTQGHLLVTSLYNSSDLLPGDYNLWFRVWHDLCHITTGGSFRFFGEAKTTLPMLAGCPNRLYQDILFSEVIGQAGAYHVLCDFPEGQKLVLSWAAELAQLGFK